MYNKRYWKKYYKKHKKHILKKNKKWFKKHPIKTRAYVRKSAKKHKRKRKAQRKIYLRKNKLKVSKKGKEYCKKHPRKRRNACFRVKYGLTLSDVNKLLKKQKGKCAICGMSNYLCLKKFGKKLGVDHNHKTGKVRGMLCDFCNTGIGHLKEDIKILKKAIKYLKRTDG